MTNNPFINALIGLLYIVLVVSFLFTFAERVFPVEDTILIPISMLSLFVFSASFMGYTFLYAPLQLFLDGQKKEGVNLFLKTLGAFAVSALALVLLGLYVQSVVV